MAARRDSEAIRDPHVLLERVYDNESAYEFQAESAEEAQQAKLLTKHWCLSTNGSSLAPDGVAGFRQRFDAFSGGAFKNFDWSNVFVAGGAVLGCAQNPAMVSEEAFDNSDIDIFIVGIDDEAAATAKLRQIYASVCANYGRDALVIRTLRAVTILGNYPQRHIQIILKLFKSPAEVLLSFDLDACSVGYDGTDVWAMERFRRAMTKRYNLVDHTRRSLSYESRLAKYSQRGFAVAVPLLQAARIDTQPLSWVSPESIQGARKLVALDIRQRRLSRIAAFGSYLAQPAVKGDYSFDFARRGFPLYTAKQQDRATIFTDTKRMPQTKHQHVFVTSIDGVTLPNFDWCRLCRSKTPLADNPDEPTVHTPYVTPQVRWSREAIVYQDFDGGQVRRLMVGSFQVIGMETNWFKGLYKDEADDAAASSTTAAPQYTTAKYDDVGGVTGGVGSGSGGGGGGYSNSVADNSSNVATLSSFSFAAPPRTPERAPASFGGGFATVAAPATPNVSAFGGGSSSTSFNLQPIAAPATPALAAFGGGSGFGASVAPSSPSLFSFGGGAQALAPPTPPLAAFGGGGLFAAPAAAGFAAPAAPMSSNAQRRQAFNSDANVADVAAFQQPTHRHVTFDDNVASAAPAPAPAAVSFGQSHVAAAASAAYQRYEAQPAVPADRIRARALFERRDAEQLSQVLACATTVQAKCLLTLSYLSKCGKLNNEQKKLLKLKALQRDVALAGAVQAYEIDQDLAELLDSLTIVSQ
jgi:hypothetical protein